MMVFRDFNSPGLELPLVPVQDVTAADPQQKTDGATWIALTGHPEFEVLGLERFRGQWVRMRFRLRVDCDEWSWPRLSFDLGTSDFDACAIPLPHATPASPDIEFIFNVPDNLRLARLRPIARPGRFDLGNATVEVIGKLRAVGQMLRTIAAVDGSAPRSTMSGEHSFPDRAPAPVASSSSHASTHWKQYRADRDMLTG